MKCSLSAAPDVISLFRGDKVFHFVVVIGVTCTFVLMSTVHIFILICMFTFSIMLWCMF